MGTKKIGDLITDNMGVYEGKTKLSFGKLARYAGRCFHCDWCIEQQRGSLRNQQYRTCEVISRCDIPGGIDVCCADWRRAFHR